MVTSPFNPTQITPPRVPFIDARSGAISREWYMFFLSLWTATNDLNVEVGNALNSASELASFESIVSAALQALAQMPDAEALVSAFQAEIEKQIQAVQSQSQDINAEIYKDIQALASAPIITPQLDAKRYGSFYDLNDQTAAAINTAYAMTFSNTQYTRGVTLGTPSSRIYVDRPSIYNIQFSAQLDKTSASLGNVWIWLDVNGSTVANTATQVSLQGSNSATVAAWNFLQEMNAGDYFRLMWATDDTNCFIKHDTAVAPVPGIPSIILTVTDNIK